MIVFNARTRVNGGGKEAMLLRRFLGEFHARVAQSRGVEGRRLRPRRDRTRCCQLPAQGMTGQGEVARGDAVGHQALLDGRRRLDRLINLIRRIRCTRIIVIHIASVPEIGPLVGQDVASVVVPEERRVESGVRVFEEFRIDTQPLQLSRCDLVPARRFPPGSSRVRSASEVHLVPDEALLARASVDGVRRLPVVAVVDIRRRLAIR